MKLEVRKCQQFMKYEYIHLKVKKWGKNKNTQSSQVILDRVVMVQHGKGQTSISN